MFWKFLIRFAFIFLFFSNNINSQARIDPKLIGLQPDSFRSIVVILKQKADISNVRFIKGKENKTTFVYDLLLEVATKSQSNISSFLSGKNIPFRSFYIVNAFSLKADKSLITQLATFDEVDMIIEDGNFMMSEVQKDKNSDRTVTYGLNNIRAPQVWTQGFRGQNVVIGGQDTGYKWDHEQLRNKYRGWNGSSANHNYNWHDAIYTNHPIHSGNNPCGYNLSVPCDDDNHGTHTMGTMVGNFTSDTIGVAPEAKWIGCRNMERGYGLLTTYVECFEWFLAPYAYGDGPEDGDPSKMPHVINNSWGCPSLEGCNALNVHIMEEALMNLRSAGCVIVVSNGNSGGTCSTTLDPPAFFEGSFSVGATNSSNVIAGFSSKGPVTFDNTNRLKPNVCAPGVGVRSSIVYGGNYASYNGTSMAGPHVAGAVALIISANPNLAGEVDQIENILEKTALPLFGGSTCNNILGTTSPNNTYGYGLIDVEKAVSRARDSLYVPIIKVDQFGYRPNDQKIAVLSNPITGYNQNDMFSPGTSAVLKNAVTHQTVFTANVNQWNGGATHNQSGDQVWYFDFSNYTTPGKYYVSSGTTHSEDFIIQDTVYNNVFKTAFKTFYYQRCGIAKTAPYALPGYVDNACHLVDTLCLNYLNPGVERLKRDVSGGWHDAGDYNKYVNFAYTAVIDLLMSFQLQPQAWASDNMGIPESGNAIPDLLDEIKYETDWLLKMQDNDGGVFSMVGVQNYTSASPPSADNSIRYYGPKTTSASFSASAMFAFASSQFRKINVPLAQQYALVLDTAAIEAYNWGVNNPNVVFNNSGILGAGEQEISVYERSMRRLVAAAFLYDLTSSISYKSYVETNYLQSNFKQWNTVYPFEIPTQLALLYYAFLQGVTPSVAMDIKNTFRSSIESSTDNLPAHNSQYDAYRAYLTDANHTWGSNRTKTAMGNLFSVYKEFGLNVANNVTITSISGNYMHYVHGRNPVGLCFLSNMEHLCADRSINTVYHNWFHYGNPIWGDVRRSVYGPVPGLLSGGVNPSYNLDPCCNTNSCGSNNSDCIQLQPPGQQPVQKSYLDWNRGYPQNSWQITEPAIYYQSSYLFLLAGKVNFTSTTIQSNIKAKQVAGDIDISTYPKSIILTSSDNSKFRVSVDNNGLLSTFQEANPVMPNVKFDSGNLLISESLKGLILRSPNNTLWRLFVNTAGLISTESLPSLPAIHTKITSGDILFEGLNAGLILKDIENICYKISVTNLGRLTAQSVSCN
jgi:subtilisin family serine protease